MEKNVADKMKRTGLIILAMGLVPAFALQAQDVHVIFSVRASVPEGEQVFITGNHPELGNWQPGFVALELQQDSTWQREFAFAYGTELEYKFTRGSWPTEALDPRGLVPPNSRLLVTKDTTVSVQIPAWRDLDSTLHRGITGRVDVYEKMGAPGILPRSVLVWLPPGYESETDRRYPVLYMHDGQNVFDPSTSFLGIDWQVDEVADSLIRADILPAILIVAVYNTVDRGRDYSNSREGKAYMRFLADSLKPFIDRTYRTRPEASATATMGSSLGGLISFLLAWNYPEVFGSAACLSPAFIGKHRTAIAMVREQPEPAGRLRLYIDNGGKDLDLRLQPGVDAMLDALRTAGFVDGRNLMWFQDSTAGHNEAAWAKRVWRPLLFLFGKNDVAEER